MAHGFAEFAEAEVSRLLGLAYALTGDRHDAWDLTQETLLRVGLKWRRIDAGNPAGYARTVLVRLNIDRARRRKRERLGDVPELPVEQVGAIDQALLDALGALSPQQRSAVVLKVLEDLDHATIAARMGCSVGTARSHLSRGLARMRELLEQEVAHE